MTVRDLKHGDKVYCVSGGGWGFPSYIAGEVTKITPSGKVDVTTTHGETHRFSLMGYREGDKWIKEHLDLSMPFEDRANWLEQANIRLDAWRIIQGIVPDIKPMAGKKELLHEIAAIRKTLEAAEQLLDKVTREDL